MIARRHSIFSVRMPHLLSMLTMVAALVAPAAAGHAQPVGITAVFSNIAETSTLDPAVAFSSDGLEFVRNVYEGLLDYEPATTTLRPGLAVDWNASNDGLTYTFHTRSGVTFHDGAPFNAPAAKAGLDRIMQVNQGPATLMANVQAIAAPDETTLTISVKHPDVYFLGNLPKLAIVSPKSIQAQATTADPLAKDWFATNSAGTGPYKLATWTKNNRIELVKNESYWQAWNPAAPDRVVLRVDPDVGTALQLLQQGQIDMLGAVGPDDSNVARNLPGVKLIQQPMFEVKTVTLNMSKGPLTDKRVRQALKLAFDYQSMVDFFKGYGAVPTGPLPSNFPGVDPLLPPQQQDLGRAQQLLTDAGYPGGNFTLSYLGLKGLSYEEFAGTILQDSLSRLGIQVNQTLVPWPQMPPMMADEASAPDMSFLNQSMFTNDPTFLLRTAYYSGNVASAGGYNWSYYRNPQVDQWLDQVNAIQDDAQRQEIVTQIQQTIVDDVPVLYVVQPQLAQPVRQNWDVTYETLDYNYVVRFFYARKSA